MEQLIADIDAFCIAHNVSPTELGLGALNDRPFVAQLKAGRRVWPETEGKVRRFMEEYKQDAAA